MYTLLDVDDRASLLNTTKTALATAYVFFFIISSLIVLPFIEPTALIICDKLPINFSYFTLQSYSPADLISFLYAKHGEAYDENVGTAESMIALPREKIVYLLMAMVALYLIAGTAAELVCNFIGFAYPAYASVKVRVQ
ncbi:unnamed protein product [Strongylus vulgaris]|uniref:Uncharacterized protein n=1 Tax=Strongylus vulgaris TaxID=40348 RepID=A0A3P7KC00_STRVU|nr:unnamed protein product [Strongylus vulgaris]